MSTIIKFELRELRKLANDKNSCIVEKKVTQNLALQPRCLGNLKDSVKKLLDYKIGKFDKEFNGILLSYKNLRILHNVGTIRNDNADIHFQIQADYFIFQPHVGASLTGIVNKKSSTHLGILVHRVFNVVIPRPTEEPGDKWIGAGIQEGQEVTFSIVVLDLFGALPYIRGELDARSMSPVSDREYDEDVEMKPPQPIPVSYVDFDKTKPYVHKIGDGLYSTTKTMPSNSKLTSPNKMQMKNSLMMPDNDQVANRKLSTPKAKNIMSDVSMVEKGKNKRQSKSSEPNQKQLEPKATKKHKREVV